MGLKQALACGPFSSCPHAWAYDFFLKKTYKEQMTFKK